MNNVNKWLKTPVATADNNIRQAAIARQGILTKPPGALGMLEQTAITLAALQGTEQPGAEQISIAVFAADHGVASEGISAFPQAVTAEMVKNFANGGAAISVLAKKLDATLEVINLGTVYDPGPLENVININIAAGTANFCHQAAMQDEQLGQAMDAGRQAAERAKLAGAQLFIGGEMGIGNTTAASALACALLDAQPEQLAGPGTGLDSKGVARKTEIIRQALDFHGPQSATPLEALRCLGGFEIAALAGSYIACAQMAQPVLIDGFISSVAALAAVRICRDAGNWFLYSHTSAEPGHQRVLEALNATPLLNLGMRLGEGSGAAVTVPLLRMACTLHNDMATFEDAGVSGKEI